jgi:MoaA/NifB/PqqE/SkfB family radical SAM enzyme
VARRRAGRLSTRALRKVGAYEPVCRLGDFLRPPKYAGLRLTPKRLFNLYLVRYQHSRGHAKLWGYPLVLTIESTNACNLRCPDCFTGSGQIGRPKSMLPMSLYERVLGELGDYLLHIEFYNWGEPLLNKDIYEMVRLAAAKGISTVVSTNFSVPFDRNRARRLVSSGLGTLGVSIDGSRQESYEKYRVRGNLERVLDNVRLVNEAKRELGSATPQLIWEFHVFEHNRDDIEQARAMAGQLGMQISVDKGWVAGPEWDPGADFRFWVAPSLERCDYLWLRAVVNNDGGVAPCCGAFYEEDDYGSVADRSFKQVWNNESFRRARSLYRARGSAPESAKSLICYDCPQTLMWERYQQHRARGLGKASFEPGYNANDGFNYFFNRRPARAANKDNLSLTEAPPRATA